MTLSTSESESLRLHLGYGNLNNTALPYTPDGWWEVFGTIISGALGTGTETSSSTATTAGAVTTITVVSAAAFAVYDEAVIDVGDNAEIVVIQARATGGPETLTALFGKAHSASGYPVCTMSGKARLRLLLHDANAAWRALTDSASGLTAGIKSVDKEDVVFFDGMSVNRGRLNHYQSIVAALSQLVRVKSAWDWGGNGGCGRLEAY